MTTYSDIADLANVYLEDSFVLEIDERPTQLRFRGEFVLTENHPRYHPPAAGEQYCYARGWLVVPDTTHIEWTRRSGQHFTDATGEEDLGNIDYLRHHDNHWLIGGDWGEARAYTTDNPTLILDS